MSSSIPLKHSRKAISNPAIRQFLWGAILAVAALVSLPTAFSRNQWSVAYLWHVLAPSRQAVTPGPAPANHPEAHLWPALAALNAGQYDEARSLIQEAVARDELGSLHILALVSEAEGDTQAAAEAWERAGDYSSLMAASTRNREAGRLAEGLRFAQAAYRLQPELSAATLARQEWQGLGHAGPAEDVLRRSLADYPASVYRGDWLKLLADLLVDLGRYDEAEHEYRLLLQERPDLWRTHLDLGWVYYRRDHAVETALDYFNQGMALAPFEPHAYTSISQVMTLEGRYAEADRWLLEAIRVSPTRALWWIMRGVNARANGDSALALDYFAQGKALEPNNSETYYEAAWDYYLLGHTAEAIENIEQAVALGKPPLPSYFMRAGTIYEQAERPDEAANAYRRALAMRPELPEALAGLQRVEGGQ